MNIIYGIASYHRPECKTYHLLKKIGIPDERIIVGLNDVNDYQEYRERMQEAHFIVHSGNSAAFNRNRLIEEIRGHCVLLDDDITGFSINESAEGRSYGKLNRMNGDQLDSVFADCFEASIKMGVQLFGASATTNQMCMAQRRLA